MSSAIAGNPQLLLPWVPAEPSSTNSWPQAMMDQRMVNAGSSTSTSTSSPMRTSLRVRCRSKHSPNIDLGRRLTPGVFAATSSSMLAKAGVSSSSEMNAHMMTRMKSSERVTAMLTMNVGPRGTTPALLVSALLEDGGGGGGAVAADDFLPDLVPPEWAWW